MLDWMLEEPVDEIYEEDCKFSIEYDEFIKENCKCQEECECLTFEEFKDDKMAQLASYWDDRAEIDCEALYG